MPAQFRSTDLATYSTVPSVQLDRAVLMSLPPQTPVSTPVCATPRSRRHNRRQARALLTLAVQGRLKAAIAETRYLDPDNPELLDLPAQTPAYPVLLPPAAWSLLVVQVPVAVPPPQTVGPTLGCRITQERVTTCGYLLYLHPGNPPVLGMCSQQPYHPPTSCCTVQGGDWRVCQARRLRM